MKVLVACEYSGVVRRAFRDKGHDAFSCDLLPAEDGDWEHHFQEDIEHFLNDSWDLMIAHPECKYLANSGWHWTVRELQEDKWDRYKKAQDAMAFFLKLAKAPIPRICIENPIPGPMVRQWFRKYDQTIQPYMFGDDASKRTCLWLKGLPPLSIPPEEHWVQPRIVDGKKRWGNQTDSGQNKLGPSETRALERSRTYAGIARAFAEQWG